MYGVTWQLGVVFVVAFLLGWLTRNSSPRLRYALWTLVLIRLLLPPYFSSPTGWGWWVLPEGSGLQLARLSNSSTSAELVKHGLVKHGLGLEQPATTEAVIKHLGTGQIPWALFLMLTWGGVIAARMGMLVTTALNLRAWIRKSLPVLDSSTLDLFDKAKSVIRLQTFVDLRNSEECATPLCAGVLRPVILVPSRVLNEQSADELYSVFLHELWHIRRRDPIVSWLQSVLAMIYFFHPLVWCANRIACSLREEVCDELTVISLGKQARSYASALFRVSTIVGYQAPPSTLGILDGSDLLKHRLLRILQLESSVKQSPLMYANWLVVVVAFVLLPCAPRPIDGN